MGNKKDLLQTTYGTVEEELIFYKDHFKDKVVYCNCADPQSSEFFRVLRDNFEKWKLKKLIISCPENAVNKKAVHLEYTGIEKHLLNGYGLTIPEALKQGVIIETLDCWYEFADTSITEDVSIDDSLFEATSYLKGNGDFRNDENIEFLKEADIVVTYPAFSQFKEQVSQFIEYDKKFIVLGSLNFARHKEILPLFRDDKIWLGNDRASLGKYKWMIVPDNYEISISCWRYKDKRILRVSNIVWFTNIDFPARHVKKFIGMSINLDIFEGRMRKYLNYDARDVDRVTEIPADYNGAMGVPITFLDKHNPDQFDIIDILETGDYLDNTGRRSKVTTKTGPRLIIKRK